MIPLTIIPVMWQWGHYIMIIIHPNCQQEVWRCWGGKLTARCSTLKKEMPFECGTELSPSLSLSLFWVPQIGGVDAKNGPISRSIFGRTKIDPTTQEASKFFLSIKTSKTSEDWKKMFNKKETCASVIKHGNWKLLINGACNGKIIYKYLWMDVPLSIG